MMNITDSLMEVIASYMNPKIKEKLHSEVARCTNERFLKMYVRLDKGFKALLSSEFHIQL